MARESIVVPTGSWHSLSNKQDSPLRIVEIQTGEKCEEDDITRVPRSPQQVGKRKYLNKE